MGMVQDAEVLALGAQLSRRRRAPFVSGSALLELCMARRIEYGDSRLIIRHTTPTGDRAADRVLTALAGRRFAPKIDKALSVAWGALEDELDDMQGASAYVRKRVETAIRDRGTPPWERAFAALAVSAGISVYPALKGRRSRGPEAAMLVLGPQAQRSAPLVKATIAEVGVQMSSVLTTPSTGEMFRAVKVGVGRRVGGTAGLAKLVEPLRVQLDEPTIADTVGLDLVKGVSMEKRTQPLRREALRSGGWTSRGEVATDSRQFHHAPGRVTDPSEG